MSSQIDTNGIFSEAAYGTDGPQGLTGVTGGGEAHEASWKQALVQAKSLLMDDTGSQVQTVPRPACTGKADTASTSPPETAVKTDHPLSWDRLSMTVASMVAWNMSVELADDVAASPLADDEVPQGPWFQGADVASEQELLPDPANMPDPVAPAVKGTGVDVSDSTELPEPLIATADEAELGTAPSILKSDTGPDLDPGPHTPLEQTFREGTRDSIAQVATRDGSTGLRDADLQGSGTAQQGTTPSIVSQPIMMSVTNAGVSEIPSSSIAKNATASTSSSQADSQQLGAAARDESTRLDSIVRVRSSSALPLEARLGQERLDSIRSVLSELETQAAVRNTVAELIRAPRPESIRPDSMTGLIGSGGIADQAVSKQGAATVQSNGIDRPVLKAAAETTDSDSGQTYGRVQASGVEHASAGEDVPRVKRPLPNGASRSAGIEPVSNSNGQATAAMNTPYEAVVGTENAEITSDQEAMVDVLEVDGATIEADEIPELAVQDISHLDVDVDDPMGAVRVAMTREADEVSIRMETPAEALEEYRKMEEEMAEAMASQGLDLSNFSADAQDSGEDVADELRGDNARTARDVETSRAEGEQPLEQSGSVSRLVNRIV